MLLTIEIEHSESGYKVSGGGYDYGDFTEYAIQGLKAGFMFSSEPPGYTVNGLERWVRVLGREELSADGPLYLYDEGELVEVIWQFKEENTNAKVV